MPLIDTLVDGVRSDGETPYSVRGLASLKHGMSRWRTFPATTWVSLTAWDRSAARIGTEVDVDVLRGGSCQIQLASQLRSDFTDTPFLVGPFMSPSSGLGIQVGQ